MEAYLRVFYFKLLWISWLIATQLISVSQLTGQKATQFFWQLKYLIEHTVALMQQVDSTEQRNDI